MKNERILFCASLIVVFIITNSAFAYSYEVIDLGALGGSHSRAMSVNNKGQIVGYAFDSSNNFRACLFDAANATNNRDLGYSEATFISDDGQIVGYSGTIPSPANYARLFDPSGGGNNINLGALGGSHSVANSMNNGQIVGYADNSAGYKRACLFDANGNGNNTDLGALGGNSSWAYSINNGGKIVGWASNSSNYDRACLFDPAGNTDLGTLGGDESEARAINNIGQVVGQAQNSSGYDVACLFGSAGHPEDNLTIVKIAGGRRGDYIVNSEALSINDKGQIVGYTYDDIGNDRAYLFDSSGGYSTDLNTLIDPSSGWLLRYAYCINNDGWIVGQGNLNGTPRAFLLVIPEPVSVLLLAAGAALLPLRRRKK
ncbi:MAG: PEP-CTERM sorting domain-containing protein [Sedimentisphaerales bacterium]